MLEQRKQLETELVALYEAHAPGMTRYAGSLTHCADLARDAVQETFVRYFVERSYGRLIEHPRGWLFQVLRRYLFDGKSSASFTREVPEENLREVSDPGIGPENMAQQAEMAGHLTASLSIRERECLDLRAEGLSYLEIAEVMGLKTGTVGAMLARAHQKIRTAAEQSSTTEADVAGAVRYLFNGGHTCPST